MPAASKKQIDDRIAAWRLAHPADRVFEVRSRQYPHSSDPKLWRAEFPAGVKDHMRLLASVIIEAHRAAGQLTTRAVAARLRKELEAVADAACRYVRSRTNSDAAVDVESVHPAMEEVLSGAMAALRVERAKAREQDAVRGVTLRQLARIIAEDGDPERVNVLLKRWNKSRSKKPDSLGRLPGHSQTKLYEPTAIVKWAEDNDGPPAIPKALLLKRLMMLAVAPRTD